MSKFAVLSLRDNSRVIGAMRHSFQSHLPEMIQFSRDIASAWTNRDGLDEMGEYIDEVFNSIRTTTKDGRPVNWNQILAEAIGEWSEKMISLYAVKRFDYLQHDVAAVRFLDVMGLLTMKLGSAEWLQANSVKEMESRYWFTAAVVLVLQRLLDACPGADKSEKLARLNRLLKHLNEDVFVWWYDKNTIRSYDMSEPWVYYFYSVVSVLSLVHLEDQNN